MKWSSVQASQGESSTRDSSLEPFSSPWLRAVAVLFPAFPLPALAQPANGQDKLHSWHLTFKPAGRICPTAQSLSCPS